MSSRCILKSTLLRCVQPSGARAKLNVAIVEFIGKVYTWYNCKNTSLTRHMSQIIIRHEHPLDCLISTPYTVLNESSSDSPALPSPGGPRGESGARRGCGSRGGSLCAASLEAWSEGGKSFGFTARAGGGGG